MSILNTLAPVFILIAVGVLLRRFSFFDDVAAAVMNRSCYWIGLPALLFYKIGMEPMPTGAGGRVVVALLGGTIVLFGVAMLTGLILRQKASVLATFTHVAFRGNLAYVGLPVVVFAFEQKSEAAAASAIAAMGLGVCVVFYNVVAVILHLAAEHRLSVTAFRRMAFRLITNPLLLACVAGFLWQHTGYARGIVFPVFLERTLLLTGQFALPLALLSVGCALVTTPMRYVALPAVMAALLKTVAGPLAGYVFSRLMGLSIMETGVVCIMLGTPTAIASYVLTEQLHGDCKLAAGTIAMSTVLSLFSLSVILWVIG